MKILVPTDFSASAKNAAGYAAKIAQKLNASVTLFHVTSAEHAFPVQASFKTAKISEAIQEADMEDMMTLKNMLAQAHRKLKIDSDIVNGYSADQQIVEYAAKNNYDLIVMGTKGVTGLAKVLIGSNAAGVLSESAVPVIVVPSKAEFKSPGKIVYASDFSNIKSETKLLVLFAKLFSSSIDIIHIVQTNYKKPEIEKLLEHLTEKNKYEKISIHIIEAGDIAAAIDKYIQHSRAGMLAMFTHKPTLFEKLFGKSITRELSFHSRIPLLSLKR